MTPGQAWIVIIELAIFNTILAVVVIVTLIRGLRGDPKPGP